MSKNEVLYVHLPVTLMTGKGFKRQGDFVDSNLFNQKKLEQLKKDKILISEAAGKELEKNKKVQKKAPSAEEVLKLKKAVDDLQKSLTEEKALFEKEKEEFLEGKTSFEKEKEEFLKEKAAFEESKKKNK